VPFALQPTNTYVQPKHYLPLLHVMHTHFLIYLIIRKKRKKEKLLVPACS
jgi:hypothetical protein